MCEVYKKCHVFDSLCCNKPLYKIQTTFKLHHSLIHLCFIIPNVFFCRNEKFIRNKKSTMDKQCLLIVKLVAILLFLLRQNKMFLCNFQ